jgi:tetratricopeptide (TPR) repeat protein
VGVQQPRSQKNLIEGQNIPDDGTVTETSIPVPLNGTQEQESAVQKEPDRAQNQTPPLTYLSTEHDILLDPNSTWSYFNKGRLLYDQGKFAEALPFFEDAVRRDNRNADAYYFAGASQVELSRFTDALVYLNTATTLQPTNAGAWVETGRAYEGVGKTREAIEAYARADTI